MAPALTSSVIHQPEAEDSTPRLHCKLVSEETDPQGYWPAGRPGTRRLVPVRAQTLVSQNAFNRIDPTSSMEEIASAQQFAARRHNQDTTFAACSRYALSGTCTFRHRLPPPTNAARVAIGQQEMMSLTDLCNRLVVTSIRQMPNSRA